MRKPRDRRLNTVGRWAEGGWATPAVGCHLPLAGVTSSVQPNSSVTDACFRLRGCTLAVLRLGLLPSVPTPGPRRVTGSSEVALTPCRHRGLCAYCVETVAVGTRGLGTCQPRLENWKAPRPQGSQEAEAMFSTWHVEKLGTRGPSDPCQG